MKKLILVGLCLLASLTLCSCGTSKEAQAVIDNINTIEEIDVSDIDVIKKTVKMYDELTEEQKEEVKNYSVLQEAEKKLPELEKEFAIQNDKTPPSFSGLSENDVIEVNCGTDFNLNDYLGEKLKITDDVTEGDLEYQTDLDQKVYDSITGKVDTQYSGEYPIILSAKDEAGNEGKLNLLLNLKPIHVTKKHQTPTIYDGEYATIKLTDFEHGNKEGEDGYHFTFEINNKMDKAICVYLPYTTSINDYQVGAYYTVSSIAPGKRGKMYSVIYDTDIPEDIGKYKTIESAVCIAEVDAEKSFYSIPIVFDVNVSK